MWYQSRRRAGGCAMKLRAVCRPMEVRGAAAVMADTEAARGESAASAADLRGGAEAAVTRHGGGVEELRGQGGRSGAMRRPWKR